MSRFSDRLLAAVDAKRSHVCVGLDPDLALMPAELRLAVTGDGGGHDHSAAAAVVGASADAAGGHAAVGDAAVGVYREFLTGVLDAVTDIAVAVKPQLAYFEALGPAGYALYGEIVAAAQERGLLVIADAKRGDIGSTAEAYARAHLDVAGADAVTVNPWFGTDGLEPFLRRARDSGAGVFVLVKTSNPSSAELQDLGLADGGTVYERAADLLLGWAEGTYGERGYASVGAVVGATHPQVGADLRRRLPGIVFLAPGYGAQGASADDLVRSFDADGTGCLVNSSRAILYAYRTRGGHYVDAARAEAEAMRQDLWRAAGRTL